MKFGQRAADAPAGASNSGDYLWAFKEGDTEIHVLDEIDDWTQYWEHFRGKQGYPCTGDLDTCPGCLAPDESERKASRRYGANAVSIKDNRVHQYKFPVTLYDKFKTRAQRNDGTLMKKSWVVIRSGKGFDTEYDVESGNEGAVDPRKYSGMTKPVDEVLIAMYESVHGEGSTDSLSQRKDKPKVEVPPLPPLPEAISSSVKPNSVLGSDVAGGEPAPWEQPQPVAAKEDVVLTEAQIREMTMRQLYALAEEANVDVDDCATKNAVIDRLLEKLAA